MNKISIILKSTEDESRIFSQEFNPDMEVEWRLELTSNSNNPVKLTFRAPDPSTNPIYTFINKLILTKEIMSIGDIDKVSIILNNEESYFVSKSIKSLITTTSVMATEVVFLLNNLDEDSLIPLLEAGE